MDDSLLLLASRDYINHRAVLATLAAISPSTLVQVTSYRVGIGHVVAQALPVAQLELIKWQPTRPTQPCTAARALLFWDGTHDESLLRSLVAIRRARVPVQIIDLDGNPLDLPTFCARLKRNGGNGSTMASASTTTDVPTSLSPPHGAKKPPTVIVDSPAVPPGQLASKDAKVRLQLHVPEATVEQYEVQARAVGQSLEKVLSDRLRTCVEHTSGRGLYFNDSERSDLERITGGHSINDAPTALNRVRTTVTLKVGGITIELTDRVLARCSSRAKAERRTLEDYVRKEVIQGLERSTGLRPF